MSPIALFAALLAAPAPLPEGLFYQLPPDGAWARFETAWTYKAGDQTLTGSQTLWMASVGEITENGERCRWIEFRLDAVEGGVKKFWIRKLLIPARYLRRGENPTAHVIRGWTLQEDRDVEPAVAVHGRWPAFLAGAMEDRRALPPVTVKTSLGDLPAEGEAGWIAFDEGATHSRVSFETRLHPKAPFGVLESRIVFEVTGEGGPYTIDSHVTLVAMGSGAVTGIPNYK
ncbi:MAG TPA: hypothetical protein VJU15_09935 [Gemmatimonadales bacterium]|nr:hypothetical protein [Gemmatimonadales bacterium]